MPKYSNTPQRTVDNESRKGAVIVFHPRLTDKQIQDAIAILFKKKVLESCGRVQEFNPEYGSPVFYIP